MARLLAVLVVASMVPPAVLVLTAEPAAAPSRTWTSDADFAGGTFTSTRVVGSGTGASIQLGLNPMYDWIRMDPAVAPPSRRGVAMTFDEANGAVLAFGGRRFGGEYRNDLWAYRVASNTWTNLTPATSPSPRWKPGFSYDPAERTAILIGGWDRNGSRDDVWRYYVTNNTWLRLGFTGPHPRGLYTTPLAYDAAAGVHILAGTNWVLNPPYGILETWSYDAGANAWTLLNPNPLPSAWPGATVDHTLTYDRVTGKTVLFGGSAGILNGDLWEYDYPTRTWVLAAPYRENMTPNPRTDHAMVFGPNRAVSLLFGGVDKMGGYPPETWVYIGVDRMWVQPPVGFFPLARKDHGMAWDSENDRVVMYGGLLMNDTVTDETWVWGPGYYPRGTYVSPTFDAGCNAPLWKALWWNATTPPRTTVRFKLATSASPDGPFTFHGWDGLPGTYYNGTPGQPIWSGHNVPPDQRYLRWMAALTTGEGRVTPALEDVGVDFLCFPALPYITYTDPVHLESGVPQTASIVVGFSEAMDPMTVSWSFSDPAVAFTASWNGARTWLVLSHSTPFRECAFSTMQIFGKDADHGYDLVAGPVPNPWRFSTPCDPPEILETVPADRAFNVPLDAALVVTFSEPMDTPNVTWAISGGIGLTGSWDAGEAVLTLSHGTPFAPCAVYAAEITAARDKRGLPLVAGPVPNPWSFTTACPNPYLVRTDPADQAILVPLAVPIVVTFSEPMNVGTVDWGIDPFVDLRASWTGEDLLTLTHAALFAGLTRYTVTITGRDKSGLPLVPGPVPNPWSFRTVSVRPLAAPANLRVAMAGPDVSLSWDPVPDATEYRVYGARDRFEPWPWPRIGTTTAPTFLARGHGSDLLTHHYVVRASDGTREGPNSTMGTKAALHLGRSLVGVDIAWFSLPYVSAYARASDIARELGPESIDVVGKWVPERQTSIVYYYARGAWRGTDFPIGAGDGLYLGVRRAFVWNVTGTDANVTLSFTRNPPPMGNVDWIGLPHAGVYGRASDIARELGPGNVTEIGLWDERVQAAVWYYWTGSMWIGTDFVIDPGAGVYLVVASDFSWTPGLLTFPVP